jgi:hypothetical protein
LDLLVDDEENFHVTVAEGTEDFFQDAEEVIRDPVTEKFIRNLKPDSMIVCRLDAHRLDPGFKSLLAKLLPEAVPRRLCDVNHFVTSKASQVLDFFE